MAVRRSTRPRLNVLQFRRRLSSSLSSRLPLNDQHLNNFQPLHPLLLSPLPPRRTPPSDSSPAMSMVLANSSAQDTEIVSPPTDSISAVSFSPTADILGVTSWDNAVSTRLCFQERFL